MVKPLEDYVEGGLSTVLGTREFMRPPVYALANAVAMELEEFIRRAFSHSKPANENDLNAKIDGFLSAHKEKFQKEHPTLVFATARTVSDHSTQDLLVEAKFVRGSTSPSKATEGIAADLTKYPDELLKLFVVYDPDGRISERDRFKRDFEQKRHCIIHIV